MSLLALNDIHKEFLSHIVLEGVSLSVQKGEVVALAGRNGCGKSTLLKIAMGFVEADKGSVITARGIKTGYLSQHMDELETKETLKNTALHIEKIARMEQKLRELENRMGSLKIQNDKKELERNMTIYSKLLNDFERADGYTVHAKIKATLLGLGLKKEALTVPVENLSGGEKMRVALARILLNEPDLLILDEPVNHLDIKAVEWLEDFLKRFGGGVLLVAHDRYFLDKTADRVAELEGGTIVVSKGCYSDYMIQKKIKKEFLLKETKRLEREEKRARENAQKLKGMRNISAARSWEKKADKIKNELNEIYNEKKEGHLNRQSNISLPFENKGHISSEIAFAKGLSKNFGSTVLFSDINFIIYGGERVGIIGANGCGKTTLFNILMGKDKASSGKGCLGSWVNYSYLSQEVSFSDENRSIIEEVFSYKEMTEAEAKKYMSCFRFYGDEVYKKINILSGGEKVRLKLALIMLEKPACLLMDEPTNHLDIEAREVLESALEDFFGTVIAISHDRYFLNKSINKIMEFEKGTVNIYDGNYDSYKTKKNAFVLKKEDKKNNGKVRKEEHKKEVLIKKKESEKKKEHVLLEQEIIKTEKELGAMEDMFGKDTDYKEYIKYSELKIRLDDLYKQWEEV